MLLLLLPVLLLLSMPFITYVICNGHNFLVDFRTLTQMHKNIDKIILGALRRCYQCRSRGELGSCKDPFKFNVTQIENEHGISAVPCASGWCGKVIESVGTLRDDGNSQFFNFILTIRLISSWILDYDMATQRMCVQRGPSDSEDRCAHTTYNYKKVYMCFCQGDLCNTAAMNFAPNFYQLALISIAIAAQHLRHYA